MNTRTISFKDFVKQEFGESINDLTGFMQLAYEQAENLGKTVHEDGTTQPLLLPELEIVRLADAQGDCAQNQLYYWGANSIGLEAGFETNSRKRAHVFVSTKNARLTCHRVQSPTSFPPHAEYRRSNAMTNEGWLPGIPQPEITDNQTYLFMLHGPSENNKSQLGFIRLAVPNPKAKGYLACLDVYRHDTLKPMNIPEEIDDTAIITLKINKKENVLAS